VNSDSEAGVMVVTTPGTVYQVANGVSWDAEAGVTSELAPVVVYAAPAAGAEQGNPLAAFGSVEVVYLAGEVTVAAGTAAAKRSQFGL
jgi:hypothetical protein